MFVRRDSNTAAAGRWQPNKVLQIPSWISFEVFAQFCASTLPLSYDLQTLRYYLTMAGPIILVAYCLWEFIEAKLAARQLASYRPVPLPEKPSYTSRDVSIVVCTLKAPDRFISCMQTWLDNDPGEIVLVTTVEYLVDLTKVIINSGLPEESLAKIRITHAPQGKRAQLSHGVLVAQNEIIASCDDQIAWHPGFLKHMLAPMEDHRVGAVAPTTNAFILPERRHPDIVTGWEVAALRLHYKRNPGLKTTYAAARWCYIMAGCSCLIRASILRDPAFQNGYNNDYWLGKHKLDVGEDCFMSRWLHKCGWTIAVQATPETEVWRAVRTTTAYFTQMVRWERSTIQCFLRSTWEIPQIWSNFYVARKTLERITRPIWTWFHIAVWLYSLATWPLFTLALVMYYIARELPTYTAFFEENPYTRRLWWAVVASDFFYVIQDPWSWATLSDTAWEHRPKT